MPKDTAQKRVFSIGEAAAFLGVSIDTLRDWEKIAKITPIRTAGGSRRYYYSELKKVQLENPLLAKKMLLKGCKYPRLYPQ